MEHCKISKLLNDSTASKFVTKKWIEVNDLSSGQYSASKNIRLKLKKKHYGPFLWFGINSLKARATMGR